MKINIAGKYYNLEKAHYLQFVASGEDEEGTVFDLRIVWESRRVFNKLWEKETRAEGMSLERVLFLSSALGLTPFPNLWVESAGVQDGQNMFSIKGNLTGTGEEIKMPQVNLPFLMQWVRKGVVIWDDYRQFTRFIDSAGVCLSEEETELAKQVLRSKVPTKLTKSGGIRK